MKREGAGSDKGDEPAREQQPLAAICGLDDPVRRRLYEYVSARPGRVSRDEVASATGVGRPLAAYHLDRLVAVGLLEAGFERSGGRRGPGAGRPAKVYARSSREFAVTFPPREYELAGRLLAEAVESDPDGAALHCLRRAARAVGNEMGQSARGSGRTPCSGQPAWQAMRAALREHQFEPYDDGDARLGLRNCPFHRLAVQHRDVVCTMNLALIEGMTDGLGASDLRPVLDPGPGRCCVVVTRSAVDDDPTPEES
jgi:predicted ArsR family transcriptional regulator